LEVQDFHPFRLNGISTFWEASDGDSLSHTLGLAYTRHLDAPREVHVLFASRRLKDWDPTFIADVSRDGIILYRRGPLPLLSRQELVLTRVIADYISPNQMFITALDVVVPCDLADHGKSQIINSPILVVEVLSLSTEMTDRFVKLALYQPKESIQ
jgi:hypothetical protein